MKKTQIALNDWSGYGLFRTKKLGENIIQCGLGSILANMAAHQAGVDFDVILVINLNWSDPKWILKQLIFRNKFCLNPQDYTALKSKYPFIKKIIYRSNFGRDIGAYNCGYQYLKKLGYQGDVLFLNTGLGGPSEDGWLLKYRDLFYGAKNVGLCGISMNPYNTLKPTNSFMPHVQSFFLYTNMDVLKEVFPNNFCGIWIQYDKHKLIEKGEIEISQRVLNKGYGICCLALKNFYYFKGMPWTASQKGDLRYSKDFSKFANQI